MIPGPMGQSLQQPVKANDPIEQAKQHVMQTLDPKSFQQRIQKLQDPKIRAQLAQMLAQQQDPPSETEAPPAQGQQPQQPRPAGASIGSLLNGGQ